MSLFSAIGRIFGKVGKWSSFGLNFMPIIGQAMTIIELISATVTTLKGQAKQDQAVNVVKLLVESSETLAGRDLVNDAEVLAAVRAVMDAQVKLQNLLAKKSA